MSVYKDCISCGKKNVLHEGVVPHWECVECEKDDELVTRIVETIKNLKELSIELRKACDEVP